MLFRSAGAVVGLAGSALPLRYAHADGAAPRAQAVAFDAFTTFDPRPVNVLAETLFPGQGTALVTAWRTRQFEYTWLRTLMNRYAGFLEVTEEALVFAAALLKLELTAARRSALMQAFMHLQAWPDAQIGRAHV